MSIRAVYIGLLGHWEANVVCLFVRQPRLPVQNAEGKKPSHCCRIYQLPRHLQALESQTDSSESVYISQPVVYIAVSAEHRTYTWESQYLEALVFVLLEQTFKTRVLNRKSALLKWNEI
jgi:hypothetical protein